MPINEQQWKKLLEKYERLIYTIAHRISGDAAISEFEDNVQDLHVAAMEAVEGFEKQNNGANGKFDDFFSTKGFDSYIKQVLWARKGNKGRNITKKKGVRGDISIENSNEDTYSNFATIGDHSIFSRALIRQIYELSLPNQRKILKTVVENPDCIFPDGSFNYKEISKKSNLSYKETIRIVQQILQRFGE